MILFILILIYLISVAVCLIACYYDKKYIHDIGDLLDETEGFMWIPGINTALVIVFCLCLGAVKLWELSKLNVLWEKFRNIKLR